MFLRQSLLCFIHKMERSQLRNDASGDDFKKKKCVGVEIKLELGCCKLAGSFSALRYLSASGNLILYNWDLDVVLIGVRIYPPGPGVPPKLPFLDRSPAGVLRNILSSALPATVMLISIS